MVLCVCIGINDSLITNALHLASEFMARRYYLSAVLQGLINVTHVVCPTLWSVFLMMGQNAGENLLYYHFHLCSHNSFLWHS